jgi:transcriptional regulator of acetoin/glycerol metabolism
MLNMKAKRRRSGATETFSVSVDADTKRALRKLADAEFEGNLSALVTDFAEEARRRMAAAAYLQKHRIPKLTKGEAATLEAHIEREIAKAAPRRARRGVA